MNTQTSPRAPFAVDSEYGELTDVLLCPPTYYDWSDANAIVIEALANGCRPDPLKATDQLSGMAASLQSAGVHCHYLVADPHLGYQTFVRDSAVMTPWGLLIANMARPERRAEWSAVLDFAAANAVPVWKKITAGPLEGGDVQVLRPGLALIGINDVRTSRAAAEQAAAFFADEGWTTRTIRVAPHFLHLDLLFCAVSDRLALCATQCLADDDVAWLEGQGFALIDISYRETMRMGCNVTALGNNCVLSCVQNGTVNDRLRAHGVTVLDPDLEQFITEGGGSHCLTMPLARRSVAP
jgi:arginine deiminase